MSPRAASRPAVPGGLCASCRQMRVVRSGRGSVFLMCERGLRGEPGYLKYPPLPVMRCDGYDPGDGPENN